MACYLNPSTRDVLVRLFRAEVYRRNAYVEFPHQAEFRLASEGMTLTDRVVAAPDIPPALFDPTKVMPDDHILKPLPTQVMIACEGEHSGAFRVGETDNYARYEWRLAEPRTHLVMTHKGLQLQKGVVAHRVTDMASFKAGKSKEIGLWAAGFACLPGATIDMLGLEYATSENEFNYLAEALLSGTKPIFKKAVHYYNDVRGGRMYLELPNGCSFACRSWKNKELLRGGQITCYIFNEIYQLPGLETYTGHAQNLRAEKGYAAFTSTPDRPWVRKLHELAHVMNPDWHCSCQNNAFVNPFTFDLTAMMADLPDWDTLAESAPALLVMAQRSGLEPGALMSREKFLISWLGVVGGFVGRVYKFSKDTTACTPSTHPMLWRKSVVEAWEDRLSYLRDLQPEEAHAVR